MKNFAISTMSLFALSLIFVSCGGTDDSEHIASAFDKEECEREENTFWDGYECFRPCEDNPCGRYGTCKTTGVVAYVCNCEDGYFSNGKKCVNPCDADPCNGVTCKATSAETYDCKCGEEYFWNNSRKACENPCDPNPCGSMGTCKATGAETYECKCEKGYTVNPDNECADINECADASLNNCPETSDCVNKEGGYECVCKTNYSGDNCAPNKREQQPCEGLPENAKWNTVSEIEQTWSGSEWLPPTEGVYSLDASKTECHYMCNTGYAWENETCINQKIQNCTELPAGASWNTVSFITQFWNGEEWIPSNIGSYNTTASDTECRFKCNTNYTWNGTTCAANSKVVNCTGLPANGKWNTVSTITQTWNGTDWIPTATGVYSTTASTTECRFQCKPNFFYDYVSSICTNPCNEDPCNEGNIANATGGCVATDWDTFSCECKKGYEWDETKCEAIHECGTDNITPCLDSATGLIWSAKSTSSMEYDYALAFCNNLEEGGFTDWRLPNIDELRSLINGCSNTKVGGKCRVSLSGGCLAGFGGDQCVGYHASASASDCGTSYCPCKCYCNDCGSTSAATISKFGDVESLWSSSAESYYSDRLRWGVKFSTGEVFHSEYSLNVRCVR